MGFGSNVKALNQQQRVRTLKINISIDDEHSFLFKHGSVMKVQILCCLFVPVSLSETTTHPDVCYYLTLNKALGIFNDEFLSFSY